MNKQLAKKIRTAAITTCLAKGIKDPWEIQDIMDNATRGMNPMSVAGVKASMSKGQKVASIRMKSVQ